MIPLGLGLLAFLLAFVQHPGLASSDTKINLHVDPGGFVRAVSSLWTPTGSLGHVQGGQYGGYMWPMAPFFSALRSVGIAPWVVQRLWFGLLLALAAWGTVRLLDALRSPERGLAHMGAGLAMVANPYVVVFGNRTTETLLGYAALPWMLLAVQRGLRRPRELAWPAAFALLLTSTGPGVNAATTAWILVGPALLLVYEPLWGGIPWRDVRAFALRAGVASLLASLWWLGPVVGHALYGIDFLAFTEHPGSIWSSTSLSESLRLMGYWISYLGVGYGNTLEPYFSDSPAMLFDIPVVVAGLLVPALAVAGLVWTRRWRYAPFFVLLLGLSLLAMAAGFPEGTPLRKALYFVYNRVDAVQFLRTTYKAAPLVALAVACLGGAALAELGARLRGRWAPYAAAAFAALLLALAAWPLVTGGGLDREVMWKRIPPAWTAAGADLDRQLPPSSRAIVLPGQPFAFYRWGGTVDPILPALTKRPVAVRNTPPYDDPHAIDMLWTVDDLVQQRRLLPGQLPPLLRLLGARSVVVGSDDRTDRSGAMPPASAARELASQPGFGRPARSYGPWRSFRSPAADLERPLRLPEVRRYDMSTSRGLVRVERPGPETIVDGSAEALAGLAAFGALPRDDPIAYAGDRTAGELQRSAAHGAALVISDSNRRRVFVPSRSRQTKGATLGAGDPISVDASVLNPFPGSGTDGQTVAELTGARSITAPFSPNFAQFPEHRPYAAFDGSRSTFWEADPTLKDAQQYIQLKLDSPRFVPYVDMLPHRDPRVVVTAVRVAGERFQVRPGWNRLPIRRRLAGLRVKVAKTRTLTADTDSAGGFDEIHLPGVRIRERLQLPRLVSGALAGRDLRRAGLTYLFSRTSGDDPLRRGRFPAPVNRKDRRSRAESKARLVATAGDGESGLARVFELPAARSFRADARTSVSPAARDSSLDLLAGGGGAATFESSSRYQGLARHRASAAFDGDPGRAWVGSWLRGRPAWISWRTRRPVTLRRFVLTPAGRGVRVPVKLLLRSDRGAPTPLVATRRGEVLMPHPVRGRSFRLDVIATAPGRGGPHVKDAVGIGELRGSGIPRAREPGRGRLAGRCGDFSLTVSGRRLRMRVDDDVAALEAGRPLRARPCGAALRLAAGRHELSARPGTLRPEILRLSSPSREATVPPRAAGQVLATGRQGRDSYDDVKVRLNEPAWLVLGQGYNRGWRAYCDGRSLRAPRVIDGFSNGWLAPADCRSVRFAFAPQGPIDWGYRLGALACLVLALVGLLQARRRRPASAPPRAFAPFDAADHPPRWPPARAARAGLAVGVVAGFVFAIRVGVLVAPGVALLLWRGVGARKLLLAASALLVAVVPLIYVIFLPKDRGGYNTAYAASVLAAHWAVATAFVLTALSLWRMLAVSRARGPRDGPAAGQAAEAEARSAA
jgi:arabinofuranan 3-O-arabinosyltransferase